ncbi:MAG: methylmalonyl-CoA mutase family protein [Chloroflexi bacterium]|nr:methylmalonyl-CoA mutase family protein [Chloroflexota bacterium]
MVVEKQAESLVERRESWERTAASQTERRPVFTTASGRPLQRIYDPADVQDIDYLTDIGFPGEYPFTRGIHPTGYRGRLWTIRMFAGFGTAEETNKRLRYLLDEGETGLSIAFDLPTLMGLDADDPSAAGEFGRCGVCVSSLADMEILLSGIPLDRVSTSMTINSPAAVIWAMYIAAAEKQGVERAALRGTLQNDILKEYMAQNEYIFPPEPAMRLVTDTIEFATHELPLWNPISVSGYHIREAGATAAQELAFTLADGMEYVRWALDRGLDVDAFAPRISFFFNSHNDFLEEVAKFRAARRIWARVMRERFGAKDSRSWWLRFHAQTAGCTLYQQQPKLNVVRTAFQALAAVLGGAQSLHTNALDEALSLPSEEAALLALRTQQIVAHETGVTDTVDPLGGSYVIERLTADIERDCYEYFDRIDAMGGVLPALEEGFFQREISDASFRYQQEVDRGERILVGVNEFVTEAATEVPAIEIDPDGERQHSERLHRVRSTRDERRARACLERIRAVCSGSENIMPALLEAAHAYCTLGEICGVMREALGEYQPAAWV